MIHLDTSFTIRALVSGTVQDRELRRLLEDGAPLAMSAVAWAELLCGPLHDEHRRTLGRLIPARPPFEEPDAELAASLFNRTGRRQGSLADCMIAAAAIRAEASFLTSNRENFERLVPLGLRLAGS